MNRTALSELNEYWIDFFKSKKNSDIINYTDEFGDIPQHIRKKFQFDFFPEPFYGYLHEDMSNDVLVPLINPGQISVESLKPLFPTSPIESVRTLSNNRIKERHLTWNKKDYLQGEINLLQGNQKWRSTKFNQCKIIMGEDIGFLHTIEFFPFHSARWNLSRELQEKWIYSLKPTKLAINAIEEISKERKVKHILGIGKVWATILNWHKDKFSLEEYQELYGPKGGRSHIVYKYKPLNSPSSLPIVIYSGSSMHLPTKDEKAVNLIRRYLEICK
ncbi:hypothetical protein DZB84_18430 [Bacillus sp. HNG]|uniref:hypothetical protein n=1 Tax=Bacillus sp. HNG TaxID=2293325 RepID=UPI000E2E5F19|nr:hypothetical protein [Bacillus sp. HNG]RFB12728.1 hypothetical protein DZB84_18430 [Bacillus sp. HNG]